MYIENIKDIEYIENIEKTSDFFDIFKNITIFTNSGYLYGARQR